MRYPKLRELKEAIRSLFSAPYTIKFPKQPSLPAVRFRGKPQYYKDDCVGCSACAEVCPAKTIEVKDDIKTKTRSLILRLDNCIFCGSCQENCITEKGIRLGSEYDLAVYDRAEAVVSVEKELIVCGHCGCVIGAKDHLMFLAKKLDVLAYGNPTFIFANQNQLRFADLSLSQTADPTAGRPAMFKVLCPSCRRAAMLKDEYGREL